ncbi:MAG: FecR family protein [Methyloglobulus sp.]|nr:FecR family protein [Methyloglobulus sp.]
MKDKYPPMTGSPKEQAGYWIVRQHSGNWSAQEAKVLQQWLAESHEHRLAFQQVQALWRGLDQFKTQTALPQLNARQRRHRFQPQRWAAVGLCAASLLIAVFLLKLNPTYLIPSETTYTTAKGQQTAVTLADGSEIVLNTDTELKVQLTPLHRRITLDHGEATFKVAHELLRGFTVKANSGEIQDIGTQFNVNMAPEQVVVTVTEGAVRVQTKMQNSPPLVAGQRLSYNPKGIVSLPDRPDLATVTAWQHGQIVFDMTSLSDAAEQLSRYHPVKIVFDDPKLKQLKISGTFNTKDLPIFLSTLESIYPLITQHGNNQTVHIRTANRR